MVFLNKKKKNEFFMRKIKKILFLVHFIIEIFLNI